eukprot:jgi/Mesen1/3239/ME000187S02402
MSWMPGWKRQTDTLHLVLGYGEQEKSFPSLFRSGGSQEVKGTPGNADDEASSCKYRIQVDWAAGEDDEAVALRLQSQIMVTLPPPHDFVKVDLKYSPVEEEGEPNTQVYEGTPDGNERQQQRDEGLAEEEEQEGRVNVSLRVHKHREPLKVVCLSRTVLGGGPPLDGLGILTRVLDPGSLEKIPHISMTEELLGYTQNWRSLSTLSLSGCGLTAVPSEIARLPMLERLHLDSNRISVLPPELGMLAHLQELRADHNLLTSVPIEVRQCTALVELSLEHNKLVRPLLDFRSLAQLRVLRLFGNPLEFFPEILPCTNLRHLTLANVRIESDADLASVDVSVASEAPSYFGASKHKLSAFFALIFRYSSVHHPLLASALARIAEDSENRQAIGKDEGAIRQIVSMVLSDTQHVVEQACLALSSLAADGALVLRLMKADVLQAITSLLHSRQPEILVSVLRVVANLGFSADEAAVRLLSRETVATLRHLCSHSHILVQRQALLALGNLAFCPKNRRALLATDGLRDLLLRIASYPHTHPHALKVPDQLSAHKAAARVLAILGENEYLRRATRRRPVGVRGVRILAMDGGGMRGMATVEMLQRLESGTGRRVHELFDVICGTSTGGMLAVALGVKRYRLEQCNEVYRTLGKLVFSQAEQTAEQATWREKLDQLYKSSSQNIRVMVQGSKHTAVEFERLLREMTADEEDGDLLIDSAPQGGPKVLVVATLVSVNPATPFVFRNYQYPPGVPEVPLCTPEGPAQLSGSPAVASVLTSQVGPRKAAFVGSCKFRLWEAIRASSAAPYYIDDFNSGGNRWQDGAIVANNPALIAVREARLLWPDAPIDCIVSLGCGQVPLKPRGKGGWRIADTGQVLVESACSIERAEEALDTFLPLVTPPIRYFRFNPIDERCGMELDETDPVVWKKLLAATGEYVDANKADFDAACSVLAAGLPPPPAAAAPGNTPPSSAAASADGATTAPAVATELGYRRKVLLVEGRRSPDVDKPLRHPAELLSFLSRHSISADMHDTTAPLPTPALARASKRGAADRDSGGGVPPSSPSMTPLPPPPVSPRFGSLGHAAGGSSSSSVPNSPRRSGGGGTGGSGSHNVSPRISGMGMGVGVGMGKGRSASDLSALAEHAPSSPSLDHLDALLPLEPGGGNGSMSVPGNETPLRRYMSDEHRPRATPGAAAAAHNSGSGPFNGSPPWVPASEGSQDLPPPAVALLHKIDSSPQLGVIHLALHADALGFILSWRSDIMAVAEPGDMADAFVAQAAASVRNARRRAIRAGTPMPPVRSLSELVQSAPRFIMAGGLHRFLGRHTQVLPDGTEVGSYLFRRTLPETRLMPDDARWMVGAWRDRVVICSGLHPPPLSILNAILDAGARAVIAPARNPAPSALDGGGLDSVYNSREFQPAALAPLNLADNKFVIEDEEEEEEEEEDCVSDIEYEGEEWKASKDSVRQQEEEELAAFLFALYDGLYREGLGAELALKQAMAAHPKQHYRCLLPK